MKENDYLQTADEHTRASDRLFLEFAIKKCSLTLSREEILSETERLLNKISDEKVEDILTEYQERRAGTAAAAESPSSEESALSGRSRDAPKAEVAAAEVKAPEAGKAVSEKQKKKKKSFWGDLLFYGVLIALIIGVAVLAKGSAQGPRSFAGFTAQTVLTSSMESVIPKGSLVISRYTDPNTLQIGDDITFMASETTTISHRIIGIVENYADTGQRAFQTQGVMNAAPDSELVPAVNVVGKVVFHSYVLGRAVDFVKSYWPLLLFFLAILAVLIRVLRYIYGKSDGSSDGTDSSKQKKQKQKRRGKHPLFQTALFKRKEDKHDSKT